jgi:GNAT superfamily N-acetyltransferase
MTIEVSEESITALPEYARVPIIFTVDCVLEETNRDDGAAHGFAWSERRLEVPYEKDYDTIAGEGPLQWPRHFNLLNWAFFMARCATRVVGGAAVAFDTGLTMLEGRRDLAVLWDIRVAPDARRRGVGSALFERVEAWAQLHGCRQLKIETQNTNVRACRFYERPGCQLRAIHRAAYRELPEEIQLLWYKDLPR